VLVVSLEKHYVFYLSNLVKLSFSPLVKISGVGWNSDTLGNPLNSSSGILSCSFFISTKPHFFENAQPAISGKLIVCENSQQGEEVADQAIEFNLKIKNPCSTALTLIK
jgi:hypothetical protein